MPGPFYAVCEKCGELARCVIRFHLKDTRGWYTLENMKEQLVCVKNCNGKGVDGPMTFDEPGEVRPMKDIIRSNFSVWDTGFPQEHVKAFCVRCGELKPCEEDSLICLDCWD